jgi:hypothetical protein
MSLNIDTFEKFARGALTQILPKTSQVSNNCSISEAEIMTGLLGMKQISWTSILNRSLFIENFVRKNVKKPAMENQHAVDSREGLTNGQRQGGDLCPPI